MSNNALSEYAQKLALLEQELRQLHNNLLSKKKTFNKNQQKVYDFVTGRSQLIQFTINGKQYFIKRGNKYKGFEHILLRHYGKECEGRLLVNTHTLNYPYASTLGQCEAKKYSSCIVA